ncbi:AAA family ATPase [Paracoccus onubensis]|uniref:AAA family ATPase n=1 Tax=Paracoccus onubensis TaxID=1675788 RepID=UPI0027321F1A|nr:AAA family ATPase [Paracoccus onubensis]MDP0925710.1 AAA family ATPase [Paracoccus onubensis]
MARLKAPAPRLSVPTKRLATPRAEVFRSKQRAQEITWRGLYDKAQWRGTKAAKGQDGLRWKILTRDLFTCQWCGDAGQPPSKLVADHIRPHTGNGDLFWDEDNIQCLCKSCHDGKKQALERADKAAAIHPKWIEPSLIPLTIVCGPPASGKTHYVNMNAGINDLVIDLDVIASRLSGEPLHGWDRTKWLNAALWQRNNMLGSLSKARKHNAAWLIVSEPKARHRQWWVDTMKPKQVIVLEVDERQCMANAANDGDRDLSEVDRIATQWWANYQRRVGDVRISG